MLGMYGIGEIHSLIGWQVIHLVLVKVDEFPLSGFIRHMRQGLWPAIFKAQTTQQLQAAGMGILQPEFRRDARPDLTRRAAKTTLKPCAQFGFLICSHP